MDAYTRFLIDSGAMSPSDIGTSRDIAKTIRDARRTPTLTEQEVATRTGFSLAMIADINTEMLQRGGDR